jgi:hypothetical protein
MATAPVAPSISSGRMESAQAALDDARRADSAIEAKNQEKVRRLYDQMQKMPWKPASVISLHAFPLHYANPLANELRLPAAPLGDDDRFPHIVLENGRKLGYTHQVFPMWGRNLIPNDAGEIEPTAVLPIDLALDLILQHSTSPIGGILCYEGVEPPTEVLDREAYYKGDRTGRTRGASLPMTQAIEHVHSIQVEHYLWWHGQAEEAWNGTDEKKRVIISRSNVIPMTKMLRSWGVLSSDPPWLKAPAKRKVSPPVTCRSCGTESKPGALKCTNGSCTYVFHPFKAFADLVIDLGTPGAGLALRRLPENQVAQLIRYGRFTKEDAEAAGYRFGRRGAKTAERAELAANEVAEDAEAAAEE